MDYIQARTEWNTKVWIYPKINVALALLALAYVQNYRPLFDAIQSILENEPVQTLESLCHFNWVVNIGIQDCSSIFKYMGSSVYFGFSLSIQPCSRLSTCFRVINYPHLLTNWFGSWDFKTQKQEKFDQAWDRVIHPNDQNNPATIQMGLWWFSILLSFQS